MRTMAVFICSPSCDQIVEFLLERHFSRSCCSLVLMGPPSVQLAAAQCIRRFLWESSMAFNFRGRRLKVGWIVLVQALKDQIILPRGPAVDTRLGGSRRHHVLS